MPRSAPMASAVRMVSCACLHTDGYGDDLGLTGLFQTDRLFDGNLIERVHRHFDVARSTPCRPP